MKKELERKFIVNQWPEGLTFDKQLPIRQAYIAVDDHHEVRIREAGHVYMLTVKSLEMLERDEVDITIERTRFEQLWHMAGERTLRKFRHVARLENHIIELDVFYGQHEGLMIAEVEFPDQEVATAFQPYSWMGEEVTFLPAFKNRNLAMSMESPVV